MTLLLLAEQNHGTAASGTMVRQSPPKPSCADARMAILIDKRREAAAIVAGLDVEIAMALGDRDGAQRARKEMEAQAGARWAARESVCFFDLAGELDALALRGRVAA